MDDILDVNIELTTPKYIGFWPRLGALFVDGLVIGIPLGLLTFYNILYLKSTILLVVLSLLGASYKPVMEALYGATVGKKALKIKVVNTQTANIGWKESILRNIFNLLSSSTNLVLAIMMFATVGFEYVTTYTEYTIFATEHTPRMISGLIGLVFIVDGIFMLADKKKRSLHDRIADTYVVFNPAN